VEIAYLTLAVSPSHGCSLADLCKPPPLVRVPCPQSKKIVCSASSGLLSIILGEARLGRRPTGVAHSKITRVRVLSWPLPLLTSLYFCW